MPNRMISLERNTNETQIDLTLDYSRVRAACIGKQTRAAADSYGMQTYMSEKATIDSLIELVETLKRSEEKWN